MTKTPVLIVLLLAAVGLLLSLFTVTETEYAIKFQLGRVLRADYEPGLHMKLPFVNNVRKFDRRILTLDMPPEQMNTSEQKYVDVDYFVKFRITDVTDFYVTTQGDEAVARSRLAQILRNELRAEFSTRTLAEVVSTERAVIMQRLTEAAAAEVSNLGMNIIDVRIKRIELTDTVTSSVFTRMQAERKEEANKHRSEGREQEEIIRSDADRQRQIILADAQRDAEKIRGEGDAVAAATYAQAYEQDAEFYSFHRSLQAYEKAFSAGTDVMVLDPGSDFFDYFKDAEVSGTGQ
jgi:membrane protease subunit HflC